MHDIPEEIEEEIRELGKYSRVSVHEYFWEISRDHQQRHEQLLKEAKLKYDKSSEWQEEKYYELRNEAQKSGYIAILFAAAYIEAAIYNFGAIYLGDKFVKTHLDKFPPAPKLCKIMEAVTGNEIDTGGQAYGHLIKLFKYRNSLVHSKSVPLGKSEDVMQYKEKHARDYYRAIESARCAVEYLTKETKTLNQDEFHPGIFGK